MSYRSGRICLGMACVATLRLETREPCRTGNVVDEDETCVEHGERSVTGCSEKVGEGPKKATRRGVNGSQSKFLAGTWPMSQNQPETLLF
jgi:hypothetical protein